MSKTQIKGPRVAYGIDIGIYRTGQKGQVLSGTTFAWARSDGTSQLVCDDGVYSVRGEIFGGTDIGDLAFSIIQDIDSGERIAIGIEAPMWQPAPLTVEPVGFDLFPLRFETERGYAWYLQSGASALARALSTGRLVLSLLGDALCSATLSTHDRSATVFLYEGFAAGRWKIPIDGSSHVADAFTTASAFILTCDPQTESLAIIHDAATANVALLSHWQTIARSVGLDCSDCAADCLVVGLDSECRATKSHFTRPSQ